MAAQFFQARTEDLAQLGPGQARVGVELLHVADGTTAQAVVGGDDLALQRIELIEQVGGRYLKGEQIVVEFCAEVGDLWPGVGVRPPVLRWPQEGLHTSVVAPIGACVKAQYMRIW